MSTCGTCTHWTLLKDQREMRWSNLVSLVEVREAGWSDEAEEKAGALINATIGECAAVEHVTSSEEYDTIADVPLAFVQDGSGYMATLYSKAEYGCRLWEAKS